MQGLTTFITESDAHITFETMLDSSLPKNLTKQVLHLKFKVLQRLASENDYVLACSR